MYGMTYSVTILSLHGDHTVFSAGTLYSKSDGIVNNHGLDKGEVQSSVRMMKILVHVTSIPTLMAMCSVYI